MPRTRSHPTARQHQAEVPPATTGSTHRPGTNFRDAAAPQSLDHAANVTRWSSFVNALHANDPRPPAPFAPVAKLLKRPLAPGSTVLDVGCETGKNAIPCLRLGHRVTLLDIAPPAIDYTKQNIAKQNLSAGVQACITGKLEDLAPHHGPFAAVIGTYAFSFIAPEEFHRVMHDNVFSRIAPDGYFAGGFFGEHHAWATDTQMSFVNRSSLHRLFNAGGLSIISLQENDVLTATVNKGVTRFHTFEVIGHKPADSN